MAKQPDPEDRALWGWLICSEGSPLRLTACGERFLLSQALGKASKLKLKLKRLKKYDFGVPLTLGSCFDSVFVLFYGFGDSFFLIEYV